MQDSEIIALYWARDQQAIPETSESYGGYCAAIARNILYDAEDTEDAVIRQELLAAVNEFLRHLPERKRQIFLCRSRHICSVPDRSLRFGGRGSVLPAYLYYRSFQFGSSLVDFETHKAA